DRYRGVSDSDNGHHPHPRWRRSSRTSRDYPGGRSESESDLSSDADSDSSDEYREETDDIFQDPVLPLPIPDARDEAGAKRAVKYSTHSLSDVIIENLPHGTDDDRDPSKQRIYLDEEDLTIVVQGYSYRPALLYLYYALCIATGGIVYVLGRWFPQRRLALVAGPVPLARAGWLVVTNEWGNLQIETVTREPYGGSYASVFPSALGANDAVVGTPPLGVLMGFVHRHNRFLFDPRRGRYVHLSAWKDPRWCKTPKRTRFGLTDATARDRTRLFGLNSIEVPEKPLGQLLTDEILHPFFVFQIMSIILWLSDTYYYYAVCILVISVVSIYTTYRETRSNERKMCEMSRFECTLSVYRDGCWVALSSHDLVPGDVFEVSDPSLHQVPCDALLLEGDCIVNESMLTGESIPVSKTPAMPATVRDLDMACLNPDPEVARHTLFCGTKLIRVRAATRGMGGKHWQALDADQPAPRATALVIRTGFNTAKGSLVRSILFPRPNKFRFYRDAFRFVGVMAVIAVVGFLASVANFVSLGMHAGIIIKRALDLITIVVPPALPATMSIGMTFALGRLRKSRIFCISPPRINVSGKVDIMCFDKTGTLTEDGLDVLGVQCVDPASHHLAPLRTDLTEFRDHDLGAGNHDDGQATAGRAGAADLLHAMATCHSLKVVHGDVIGDPIDIKMFEFTQWTIEEGGDESTLLPTGPIPHSAAEGPPVTRRGSLSDTGAAPPRQLGFHGGIVPTVVRPPHTQRFTLDDLVKSAPSSDGAATGDHFELGVIRSFEFLPALRRMSVIVKPMQAPTMRVFVKGAPEVMLQICRPATIPPDFHERLNAYTQHGYRVIGCAGKTLDRKMNWLRVQKVARETIEADLTFLGFIVFENKLKPTTAGVIRTLGEAQIRQAMCTGDNVLTAVSVARECGIVGAGQSVYAPRCLDGTTFADGAIAKVVWEDVDEADHVLDPYALEPVPPTPPRSRSDPTLAAATTTTRGLTAAAAFIPDPASTATPPSSRVSPTLTGVVPPPPAATATSGPANWGPLPTAQSPAVPIHHCLALTGEAYRWAMEHAPAETLEQILIKAQVFARMSPDEKQELVEKLQAIDYCVGFCGDGANDCGALKAADVGLSLSEAEASVAAPFTSQSTDIDCVLDLIKEGRCALTTSFSCFKYMALYSIIQFVTVSLLYRYGGGLGDFQFLFIDLFIIIPIAVFMGNSPPYHRVDPRQPTASLISQPVLSSLLGHILIVFGFQFLAVELVRREPWYRAPDRTTVSDDEILVRTYDNTVLFHLANFQYIFMAVVFCIGPPYRRTSLRNYPFIATTILLLAFSSLILLHGESGFWVDLFELVPLPSSFAWSIWGLAVANCVTLILAERYVLPIVADWVVTGVRWTRVKLLRQPPRRRLKRFQELLGKARR
ncbi:hypothetical protein IWQ60_008310, partial [Tieghemiomyces parasiticus]